MHTVCTRCELLCGLVSVDFTHILQDYHRTSNTRRTLVNNEFVDHLDVFGPSPVDAAPTSSLST